MTGSMPGMMPAMTMNMHMHGDYSDRTFWFDYEMDGSIANSNTYQMSGHGGISRDTGIIDVPEHVSEEKPLAPFMMDQIPRADWGKIKWQNCGAKFKGKDAVESMMQKAHCSFDACGNETIVISTCQFGNPALCSCKGSPALRVFDHDNGYFLNYNTDDTNGMKSCPELVMHSVAQDSKVCHKMNYDIRESCEGPGPCEANVFVGKVVTSSLVSISALAPTRTPTARPSLPSPTRAPNQISTPAPSMAVTTVQGSVTLGSLDVESLTPQEKTVMESALTTTIANVTGVPESFIKDVTISSSTTRRLTSSSVLRKLAGSTQAVVTFIIVGDSATIGQAVQQGGGSSSGSTSIADQIAAKLDAGGGSTFLQTLTQTIASDPNAGSTSLLSTVSVITFQGVLTIDATPTFQPTQAPTLGKNEEVDLLPSFQPTHAPASDKKEVDILVIALPIALGVAFIVIVSFLVYFCIIRSSSSSKKQVAPIPPAPSAPPMTIVANNNHQQHF